MLFEFNVAQTTDLENTEKAPIAFTKDSAASSGNRGQISLKKVLRKHGKPKPKSRLRVGIAQSKASTNRKPARSIEPMRKQKKQKKQKKKLEQALLHKHKQTKASDSTGMHVEAEATAAAVASVDLTLTDSTNGKCGICAHGLSNYSSMLECGPPKSLVSLIIMVVALIVLSLLLLDYR